MAWVVASVALALLVVALAVLAVRTRERPAAPAAPAQPPHEARTLLDLLPSGAFLLRGDDIVVSNPAARRAGVSGGGRLTDPRLRDAARRTRRDGVERTVDVTVREPTGRLPRHLRGHAVRAADGLVALLLDDVTEARRVESMRRDFVANVSHEIKTPVGAIALLVEALREASDDPPAAEGFLDRLEHEAARLSRLVQDLLDLSRVQSDDVQPRSAPVPLAEVVEEAVAGVRVAAERKGISVVTSAADAPRVAGDRGQLVTAVRNLVDNAVAYSPEGTRVAVDVRDRDGHVDVTVTDQGPGIAAADLERIFERFYRVDTARSRATGGTGLGLAIVKHIAANHGGEVTVWSEPGSGSTFVLRLPLLPARPLVPPPAEPVAG